MRMRNTETQKENNISLIYNLIRVYSTTYLPRWPYPAPEWNLFELC